MKGAGNFNIIVLFALLSFAWSKSYSQDFNLRYSEYFSEWYEVPHSIVSEIKTHPFFANTCNWKVTSKLGHPIPYLFQTQPGSWPFLMPIGKNQETRDAMLPTPIIKVFDGWLAAYNRKNSGEVYWFTQDKSVWHSVGSYRINQFAHTANENEVIAAYGHRFTSGGGSGGVLRFYRKDQSQGWRAENLVDFQFGEVYGVAPNWKEGVLVHSEKGWWKIQDDGKVVKVMGRDDLYVWGMTIAADEDTIFVGGECFVREVNLRTKTVRVLSPSPEFVAAMRQWPVRKFMAALELIVVKKIKPDENE